MEQIETGSYVLAPVDPLRPERIRMINWNINRGQQLSAVLEFLGRAEPDLILLQEADVKRREEPLP